MGLLDDEMNRRSDQELQAQIRDRENRARLAAYSNELIPLIEDFLRRLQSFGTPTPRWNWLKFRGSDVYYRTPVEDSPRREVTSGLGPITVGVAVPHHTPIEPLKVNYLSPWESRKKKKDREAFIKSQETEFERLRRMSPALVQILVCSGGEERDGLLQVDYKASRSTIEAELQKLINDPELRTRSFEGLGPTWIPLHDVAKSMADYLVALTRLLAAT